MKDCIIYLNNENHSLGDNEFNLNLNSFYNKDVQLDPIIEESIKANMKNNNKNYNN